MRKGGRDFGKIYSYVEKSNSNFRESQRGNVMKMVIERKCLVYDRNILRCMKKRTLFLKILHVYDAIILLTNQLYQIISIHD